LLEGIVIVVRVYLQKQVPLEFEFVGSPASSPTTKSGGILVGTDTYIPPFSDYVHQQPRVRFRLFRLQSSQGACF
jgi:hypothetical protein